MAETYFFDKKFSNKDFISQNISGLEFEACTFLGCNFSNQSFIDTKFTECDFIDCDLSLANMTNSLFNDVNFKGSKLIGLDFTQCNTYTFQISLDACTVDFSNFSNMDIKRNKFKTCSLKEVDFTGTNMVGIVFEECDLALSMFDRTNLSKADLSTAINYTIDPESNTIKQAIFSKEGIIGLLGKYDIRVI